MIIINTERLVIKSYDYGEEMDILNLLDINRKHLNLVLSHWVSDIDDLDKAKAFIRKMKGGALLKNIYALGVWLKDENRLIGEIVFFKIDWTLKEMEVGSYIDSAFQGRGLITEAKRESLNYFFKKFCLNKVIAVCDIHNTASQRVNEKCGFLRNTSSNANVVEFYITLRMLE